MSYCEITYQPDGSFAITTDHKYYSQDEIQDYLIETLPEGGYVYFYWDLPVHLYIHYYRVSALLKSCWECSALRSCNKLRLATVLRIHLEDLLYCIEDGTGWRGILMRGDTTTKQLIQPERIIDSVCKL